MVARKFPKQRQVKLRVKDSDDADERGHKLRLSDLNLGSIWILSLNQEIIKEVEVEISGISRHDWL